ncbi:hypothetical protein FOB41_07415 [Agrobacterium pusense]|uniref:Uncharacterized protein n=1 Tax=Agrobacterium pusense TaxID=648995 RepID=A0A6H0ZIV6_9HYPH|nr:hypothetical protein [Agrobacterium pusense]QIX20083.1 hypothetical protein FOB41_07415 [Agrobacterium pusense]
MKAPIEISRARLEAKIEELVALLDLLDGDENLEPYLADTYPEKEDREGDDSDFEPEETDQNGDEGDCCRSEDEWRPFSGDLKFDGSGNSIAGRMIRGRHRRQA